MISVVCWKWATPGYRSAFGPEHVNALRRMVAAHYSAPHRFLCVTNDARGLDPEIEPIADREDFASLPSPHGGRNPSCYRRLRAFGPEAYGELGERFVSLDLDAVILRDLRPLWDRLNDFTIWRDPGGTPQYCASMFALRAGSRPQAWTRFDPSISPAAAKAAGFRGSDQAWLSYCLPGQQTWERKDGVYSFRVDRLDRREPPEDARIVFFHGAVDPWSPLAQAVPWIRRAWGAPAAG